MTDVASSTPGSTRSAPASFSHPVPGDKLPRRRLDLRRPDGSVMASWYLGASSRHRDTVTTIWGRGQLVLSSSASITMMPLGPRT